LQAWSKNERPVFLVQVLVEPDAKRCSRQHAFKCGLAHGKRIAPHVIPVKLDQIKRPHEYIRIVSAVPDAIEGGYAIIPARDRSPVDNAGSQAQITERLDNEREAMGQIIAGPAVEPHPPAFLTGDYPEAIVLDFVQPDRPERRLRGTGWEARRDEPHQQGTRTQTQHGQLK
jgi:hypothetical protein